jgi:dihydroorotase
VQASVIDNGLLSWADLARVFSATPARIGRISGHGQGIVHGAPAQVLLYDPQASRNFSTEQLVGKGTNSPYLDLTLPGRVVATFHDGYPTVLDGELRPADEVAASARSRRAGAHV